jgi:hypothetical protein
MESIEQPFQEQQSPERKGLLKYSTHFIFLSFAGLMIAAFVIYFSPHIVWLQRVGWGILLFSMLCYGVGRVLQIASRSKQKRQ